MLNNPFIFAIFSSLIVLIPTVIILLIFAKLLSKSKKK